MAAPDGVSRDGGGYVPPWPLKAYRDRYETPIGNSMF